MKVNHAVLIFRPVQELFFPRAQEQGLAFLEFAQLLEAVPRVRHQLAQRPQSGRGLQRASSFARVRLGSSARARAGINQPEQERTWRSSGALLI